MSGITGYWAALSSEHERLAVTTAEQEHLIHGDALLLPRRPADYLDHAVGKVAAADGDPHRDPDELGVLELHARPLVPVVDQDAGTGRPQALVDRLGR